MKSKRSLSFKEALQVLGNDWQEISAAVRQLPSPESLRCSKGCGTCCHYGLIASSSLEAFGVLVAWVGQGRPLEELARKCEHYCDSFKRALTDIGHLPFSISARRAFLKHRIPCPILVETTASPQEGALYGGSCGLYAHRPTICSSFHSTDDPQFCMSLTGHSLDQTLISSGEHAAESLRSVERSVFGKSALGHLPLLLAALTTAEGLDCFLRVDDIASSAEEQGIQDFFFYVELLEIIGIKLTEADFADLEVAQLEAQSRRPHATP